LAFQEEINMSSIIFRADGNSKIGLGHLIRSSALAEMLKDQYDCVLATRCKLKPLLKELESVFKEVILLPEIDYRAEAETFNKISAKSNLILLDGYKFDDTYQQELFQKGFDLFSIDDIHAFPFYSKAIINHSGGINPHHYCSLPSTQYYLGPRYALLREPFLQTAKTRRNLITDNNCFICFGGADPGNQTMHALQNNAVADQFAHFHVIIGNAYQYKQELEEFTSHHKNISVHYAVSPSEMVDIMRQCSYAICSPSTIVYEYVSVGGIVFLEQIADNQKDVINYFIKEGMAFPLKSIGQLSEEEVKNAFIKQAFYFDGNSGERFRKLFHQYFEGKKLSVRKAGEQDLECCYHWANDPEVRAQSYNQANITLQEHLAWFNNKLKDSNSYFYILESENEPVAQIRFQVTGGEAVLGYLASSTIRAKGLGTTIIGKGIEAFVNDYRQHVHIIGYVKKANIASQRSFERLAFKKEEATIYPDSYKYTMNYGN